MTAEALKINRKIQHPGKGIILEPLNVVQMLQKNPGFH